MTTRSQFIVSIFAALLFAGSAQAFVGSIAIGLGQANEVGKVKVAFSADAEIETEEGKFSSKMNYQDEKLRDVINMGGQTMTTITRYDLEKTWTIMGQGMYMENDIGESEQSPDYKLVERSVVGKENVNGQETTKYKTLYESSRGKFGGFTWYNNDNIAVKGFMISEENGEKTRILFNLTNINVGPQAGELFELPAGASKFTMPSFGGMKGMQNPQSMGGGAASDSMPDSASVPDAAGQQPGAQQDPSIAAEASEAAKEGAREATVEESKQTAKDAVKKGFRSLFGR
jgi:hypothetical protein